MSPKKKKGRKERLKPLSFYGCDPKDVLRAFMHVSPEDLRRLEDDEAHAPLWTADATAEKDCPEREKALDQKQD